MIRRRSEIRRKAWMPRGTKPLPRVNVKRQAKRRDGYRQKLAAYRRSETYRVVVARAGGRCERMSTGVDVGGGVIRRTHGLRCEYRGKLIHNHKSYARFGGDEQPDDMEALCPTCNDAYEAERRPWNRGRKFA